MEIHVELQTVIFLERKGNIQQGNIQKGKYSLIRIILCILVYDPYSIYSPHNIVKVREASKGIIELEITFIVIIVHRR